MSLLRVNASHQDAYEGIFYLEKLSCGNSFALSFIAGLVHVLQLRVNM